MSHDALIIRMKCLPFCQSIVGQFVPLWIGKQHDRCLHLHFWRKKSCLLTLITKKTSCLFTFLNRCKLFSFAFYIFEILYVYFHRGTQTIVGHLCSTMKCPIISRAFLKHWHAQFIFDNQISCLFTF